MIIILVMLLAGLVWRFKRQADDYREALGRAEVYIAELQARLRWQRMCGECGDAPATFEGRCVDCNEMVMAAEEADQIHYERWLNGEDYD